MKKLFMIAALMVATLSANAQNEVGQFTLQPKVGINLSTITGKTLAGTESKVKVGLVAGVEGEYGIAENFSLTAGLLYSMEGAKVKSTSNSDVSVKANLDYINIPIMAQYYVAKGLALKAGIQPAFNVRKDVKVDLPSGIPAEYVNEINAVANSVKDKIKSFNLSIPVGLSYEYQSFVFDARYNIGVTKSAKDSDEGRNSTFTFTFGYKFAL